MAITRVLVVDDDEVVRFIVAELLNQKGFDVTTACSVPDALRHISTASFDVLLSDLHMPGAGDGLTVVSAMRHANPQAVTLLLSAFPEMGAAANAILLQTDEVLVKPMNMAELVGVIERRLADGPLHPRVVESVASVLERRAGATIDDWYESLLNETMLASVAMTKSERCGHLPQLFRDLVARLRSARPLGCRAVRSLSAEEHGLSRRRHGYTAAMLVEESRMLQVCTFRTLQQNLTGIDFSELLLEVMTIADEVDSQLSQAMASYTSEPLVELLPMPA